MPKISVRLYVSNDMKLCRDEVDDDIDEDMMAYGLSFFIVVVNVATLSDSIFLKRNFFFKEQ